MLTLTNRIDMRPGAVPLVIHLGQYDSDFTLVFELYSSAGNFTVESGTTAMIRGTKTDGNAYDADATIDVSAKTVTVSGSEQMTAAKGRNVYELVLKKGTKVLSTANFILDVERAAMDADTIASESVLKELNAIIAGAETATEAAANAASAADRAEDAADSVSSASAQIATNTADIADLKADFKQFVPGLSDEAKDVLLACFRGVAWLNWEEDGESLYNALATALNVEPPEPTPTFNYGVYIQDETINGKYIDASGNVIDGQANKSFYIPDYIPVVRESYWIGMQPTTWVESTYGTPRSEANWRVTEYDAQKVFIKQTQYSNNTAYSAVEHTFDTNAKYIRLGWYDPYSSAIKHFDIENPAIITALPMESGDISSSNGQNTTQALRIRTVGYIDAADGTLTFTGCPFADTWREFTANSDNQTSIYGVRCYDTSKNFLGITSVYTSDVSNVTLLSGTKYIRFIIQYANSGTFANFKSLVNHLITINGTKYFVTGV